MKKIQVALIVLASLASAAEVFDSQGKTEADGVKESVS